MNILCERSIQPDKQGMVKTGSFVNLTKLKVCALIKALKQRLLCALAVVDQPC